MNVHGYLLEDLVRDLDKKEVSGSPWADFRSDLEAAAEQEWTLHICPTDSCLSVSLGDRFQEPLRLQKSLDAQVPYIKWNSIYVLEKAMAPHSSTLAWKIPWMEEPGRLQSMGLLRVGHDWATSLSLSLFIFHALEKEMATHSSVLAWRIPGTGEPGGLPDVYGVAQSRTRLKRLSSNFSLKPLFSCLTLFK